MIIIKDSIAQGRMEVAGSRLKLLFDELVNILNDGITTLDLDNFIDDYISKNGLLSASKGYKGYKHSSCISVNDEVVHGIPSKKRVLKSGDLVKIDVCASYKGYCADMARSFFVGNIDNISSNLKDLVDTAYKALDAGINQVIVGNRIGDISYAIQSIVECAGYGIVKEFAGHGIGARMHEDPEILNYGRPSRGPLIKSGMAFAIEPMITYGNSDIYILDDGWTVKTIDGSLAAHVEDTVIVTIDGIKIITR
jgi:methionyl aminopeptidase